MVSNGIEPFSVWLLRDRLGPKQQRLPPILLCARGGWDEGLFGRSRLGNRGFDRL